MICNVLYIKALIGLVHNFLNLQRPGIIKIIHCNTKYSFSTCTNIVLYIYPYNIKSFVKGFKQVICT